MHRFDDDARLVVALAQRFVADRLSEGPPLGATATPGALAAELGETITEDGLGVAEAFRRFDTTIAPATVALDSPRFLAFIPAAPTAASALFDAVVSASSFSGESWLEAAGAVHAENEVLRFLADLAGLPPSAGGCFVSGGSAGNLERAGRGPRDAVVRPRRGSGGWRWPTPRTRPWPTRWPCWGCGRSWCRRPPTVSSPRPRCGPPWPATPSGVCAVVASAGSTNAGLIDDLSGLAEVCAEHEIWLHVDGAYGLAALLATGGPAVASPGSKRRTR